MAASEATSPSLADDAPAVAFSVVATRVESKKRKPDRDPAYGQRGKQFLAQLKQRSKPPVDPEKSRIAKEHAARRAKAAADAKAARLAKIAADWKSQHESLAREREGELARAIDAARETRERAERAAAAKSFKRLKPKLALKPAPKPTTKPTTKLLDAPPAVVGSPQTPARPPPGWDEPQTVPKPQPVRLAAAPTWEEATRDLKIEFASVGELARQIEVDAWQRNRVPSVQSAADGAIGLLSDEWGEWREHSFWTVGSDLRAALRAFQKKQSAYKFPAHRDTQDFEFLAEGANSYVFAPTKQAFLKPALVPERLMNHGVVYRFTKIDERFDAECGADQATVNSPPTQSEAVFEAVHALRAASLGIGPLVHAACLFPLRDASPPAEPPRPEASTPHTALLLVMAKAKGSLADMMDDHLKPKRTALALSAVVEPVAEQLVRLCFKTGLSGAIAFDIKVGNIVFGAVPSDSSGERMHLIDFDPVLFVNTELLGAKGRALMNLLLCASQIRAASESRERETTVGRGPATWGRAAAKVFAAPLCELWNEVLEEVRAGDEGSSSASAAPGFGAGARLLSNLRFPRILDRRNEEGRWERVAQPSYAGGAWFDKPEEERIPLLARSIVGHYLVTTAHAWPSTRAEPWRAGYLSPLGLFVPALINYACFFDAGPPDCWRELLSITAPRPLSRCAPPPTQTAAAAAEA